MTKVEKSAIVGILRDLHSVYSNEKEYSMSFAMTADLVLGELASRLEQAGILDDYCLYNKIFNLQDDLIKTSTRNIDVQHPRTR